MRDINNSCDPGGVPDNSQLAVYQTVSSLSSALLHVSLRVFASYLYFLAFAFLVVLFFFVFVVFTGRFVCVVVCVFYAVAGAL